MSVVGPDGLAVREVGPWSKDKLEVVGKYMGIFTSGMKAKWKGLVYVDLYAGPGLCVVEGTNEIVEGSPLLALNTRIFFDRVIFVEADPDSYDALQTRVNSHPRGGSAHVVLGDCNEVIRQVLEQIPDGYLTLAFIDPVGVKDLDIETLRSLATGRAVDLIILFAQQMAINRNRWQWQVSEEDTPLDRLLGREWRQSLTPEVVQFIERLKTMGYTFAEGSGIAFRNRSGARLYYLIFATRSPIGAEFWAKITSIAPDLQMRLL